MKKTFLKIAAAVVAAVIMASCFAGCGSGDEAKVYRDYKDIKEGGKIIIGVSSDNTPIAFANETGKYQGYEISFAKRLAKELNLKVKFVSTENDARAKYLETGKVDVIISDFVVEKATKKVVDFALPYMKTALGTVSAKDKKTDSLDKLQKGDTVIVINGSAAESYMAENYPDVNLHKVYDENEAIDALTRNLGALWLGNNTQIASFAQQNEGYTVGIAELGQVCKVAPAVSKGNSVLVKKINKVIEKLGKENFFHTAYDETLATDFGADFKDTLVIEGGKI